MSSLSSCAKDGAIRYEDTCPVVFSQDEMPSLLPNWMGEMLPIFSAAKLSSKIPMTGSYLSPRDAAEDTPVTLLDLSLPGTHDSLTYHLSTTVSDGGADDFLKLAEVLHKYEKIVPDGVEDFIRQQSKTQQLNITSQLNNGIRFIDFRQMLEYQDDPPQWYSLHFMQSLETAKEYYREVREWMDQHPQEIVVLWVSKHGSECATGQDQYPEVSVEQKRQHWSEIMEIFDGLLTDFSVTRINETSIEEMLRRDHRVVIYASDYVEFTDTSRFALDGCLVDNHLGPSVDDEISALEWERAEYSSAAATKKQDKTQQKLYLQSLSTGVPAEQIEMAAALKWLPYDPRFVEKCTEAFHLPGLSWCPPSLLDVAQMENYYKQISLEEALLTPTWELPNAIYLNALDWEGTIRTGSQNLWGSQPEGSDSQHATSAYAYADSMLLFNLRKLCEGVSSDSAEASERCEELEGRLESRRALHPAEYWQDEGFGRQLTWPRGA